jgi:hypothetical protein
MGGLSMSVLKDLDDIQNVVNAERLSDKEKRDAGIDYDEKHVRQSIVHSRDDIVFLCTSSGFLLKQIRRTNFYLQILIVLFGIFLLSYLLK